ncbi:hypothetical protein LOOC260_114110 [Paucilactobacillus hokkaidonensis JCM 18461]|uniref:Uncharacterized protein n=2 Tax=Paucilactobacillus hokkaidonensis TaxID=1193095 RepID=A0A0A1GUH7_9LACO|nr:DUF2977 domain-containing protein [Paucilactobacillus hokkaidonensis]KRO09965.1 hypothetical protein IV59_GL000273 [Paucilactobacillus hokkaidonensis]BAP85947.1 hypothetical protein LOOC260_114110 [Paucilactobacillus hokkaidonensis JCM 18461]
MQVLTNDKNEIIGYAVTGSLTDAIIVDKVPDDFMANFKPSFYLLKDGVIIANPNYTAPKESVLATVPSTIETQLAALAYQQMTTQQTITYLQTQNAQMAYKLMTQGGATA